jgi:hypothetical protein
MRAERCCGAVSALGIAVAIFVLLTAVFAQPESVVVATSSPSAQLLEVEPSSFTFSAMRPITMRGVNFPDAALHRMSLVFLSKLLDVAPFAFCNVDPALSSTSMLICRNAPLFFPDEETGLVAARANNLDVPIALFVGVAAPSVLNLTSGFASKFVVSPNIRVAVDLFGAFSYEHVRELRPIASDAASASWVVSFIVSNVPQTRWSDPTAEAELMLVSPTGTHAACVHDPLPSSTDKARFPFKADRAVTCRVPWVAGRGGSYNLSTVIDRQKVGLKRTTQFDFLRLDEHGDTYDVSIPSLVTGISPESVAGDGAAVLITISGTGFSPGKDQTAVEIGNMGTGAFGGGAPCRIVTITASSIVCSGVFAVEKPTTASPLFGGFIQQNVTNASNPGHKMFGTGDSFFPYQEFPLNWNISAIFSPKHAGNYTFWCAASGSIAVDLADSAATDAPLTRLCASNQAPFGVFEATIDPTAAAISSTLALAAGATYHVRIAVSNPAASDAARLRMSHTPPAGSVKLPASTVPHTVLLRAKLPSQPGQSKTWFTVKLNSHSIDVPEIQTDPVTTCGATSIVGAIKAATDNAVGSIVELQLITPNMREVFSDALLGGSGMCQWLLTFSAGERTANISAVSSTDVDASATVVTKAGNDWFYHTIPAGLFKAPVDTTNIPGLAANTTTTVRVYVNHVQASFIGPMTMGSEPLWLEKTPNTPTLVSVSPTQLATSGLSLLLQGTFFSIVPAALITATLVYTQASSRLFPCAVNSVTNTTIQCTVPTSLPGGTYRISVRVGSVGVAVGPSLYVTQGHQSVLASPSRGYMQGGTLVTITGVNFPILTQNVYVHLAGAPCIVTATAPTQILCTTTTMLENATERPVTSTSTSQTFYVRINVTQSALPSGVPLAYRNFGTFTAAVAPRYTYTADAPFLTSVFPLEIPATTGATIAVNGNLLDTPDLAVSLCQLNTSDGVCVECAVTGPPSSSQLACKVPPTQQGTYFVIAQTSSGQSNKNISVVVIFSFTSVSPRLISMYGDVNLNLTGTGFPAQLSEATSFEIRIAQVMCAVLEVQPTWALCHVPFVNYPLTAAYPEIAFHRPSLTIVADRSCGDSLCNFSYSPASDLFDLTNTRVVFPMVPTFTPTTGLRKTIITFAGLNFDPASVADDFIVTIGEVPCPVFQLDFDDSATLFYCELSGDHVAGTAPVLISWRVFGQLPAGRALDSSPRGVMVAAVTPRVFTHLLAVDDAGPLEGSIGGGTFITIRGVGFGAADFAINIGDDACVISPEQIPGTTLNVTVAICQTQALTRLSSSRVFISVLSAGQNVTFPEPFFFNASKTLILTKATPLTGEAGTTISLTVRSFADSNSLGEGVTLLGLKIIDLLLPLQMVGQLTFLASLPMEQPLPGFSVPLLIALDSGFSYLAQSAALSFISYPAMNPVGAVALAPAGGTFVTISGVRFARNASHDRLNVQICGHPCAVSFANTTRIVCAAPPLLNRNTLLLPPRTVSRLVAPLSVASFNENTPITSASTLTDGDVSTRYTVSRAQNIDLYVAIDVGAYLGAFFHSAAFFPVPGLESSLEYSTLQYSSDGSLWTTVAALSSIQRGWNVFSFKSGTVFAQYLRILAPDAVQSISVMEFAAEGYYGARSTTAFCPLIVRLQPPGSSEVSTCLLQPLLCSTLDASIRVTYQTGAAILAVSSMTPNVGPLIGGTIVTMFGVFPSVSTTDVAVSLDGQPCTVRTASAQSVTCETVPKPMSIPGTGVTSIMFRERGLAQIPDSLRFRYSTSWSDPASWVFLGFVPKDGSDIVIPRGVTIVLDVSTPILGSLTILGALITTDSTLQLVLSAERIIVTEGGTLSIGSSLAPFSGTCKIVLTSPLVHLEPHPQYGFAFLAIEGGTLQLFSLPISTSIVQLDADASAGDSSVTVSTVATWAPGSQIVLTHSDASGFESFVERNTISSYSIQGTTTTFRLATSLEFDHMHCLDAKTGVDCSDEVLLLSRSIVVQGDGADPATSAHVIIRPSDTTKVQPTIAMQFVEFATVGSIASSPAQHFRAPIHIQNYRATSVMTLNGISVHDSVYRGLFLDQCEGISLTASLFFAIDGHAVATDSLGLSRFLTISNNVVSNVRPRGGDSLPGGFYLTNPVADLSGNIVSGSAYAGYFYDIANLSTPLGYLGVCPQSAQFGLFASNSARGCRIGLLIGPVWLGRTLECGPASLSKNQAVAALIFQPLFFQNSYRHMQLQQVGSIVVTGAIFLDSGFAAVAIDEILDGGSGAASVKILNSFFGAHSAAALAAIPGTPLYIHSPSEGIFAILGPRSNGLVLQNNTFFGYETYGSVRRALLWSCGLCSSVPQTSSEYRGGSDGYTVVASKSYVIRSTQGTPQGILVLSPPFSDVLFDVDGTFSLTFLPNTSVLANVPHLSGLPGCENVSTASFWRSSGGAGSDRMLRCNNTYRFHHVTITTSAVLPGNSSFISATSAFGQTNYTVVPPRSSGSAALMILGQATVLVASGMVLDLLTPDLLRPLPDVYSSSLTSSNGDIVDSFLSISPVVFADASLIVVSFGKILDVYQSVTAIPRTSVVTLAALDAPAPNPDDDMLISLPYYYSTSSRPASYTAASTETADVILVPDPSLLVTMYSVQLNACHNNNSCVVASLPLTPRSFSWTDIRAWPLTGRVPQDGDDAVIPKGVTVTLRGQTARLHKLVVEGTLLFHTRIHCEVIANFVVILGGTIAAGNSTFPHPIPLVITLVADRDVPVLSLGRSVRVRSGTLVNYGSIQLYGYPKSAAWTTLSAVLQAGTSSVITSDVLDWAEGEEVAISSTSYDPSHAERGWIAAPAADRRGFFMNVNAEHVHSYYSISVTDSVKIAISAQVATLNRNIVIRNGTVWGCQVVLSEFGDDPLFAGETVMSNVEISGCGVPYINMTDVDDVSLNAFSEYSSVGSNASIIVDSVTQKQTSLAFAVVHDSHGEGVAVRSSKLVSITDSVFVGTYGSAVSFRGSLADSESVRNVVSRTLVMNTMLPMKVREQPGVSAAVCSFESIELLNIFTGNVAAGSESEGFCVRAGPCASTSTNSNNEAHSNVIGFFTAHIPENSSTSDSSDSESSACVVLDTIHAWKNSYMGIHSAINGDTLLQGSVVHDNHIGVHLGRMGGGANRMSGNAIGGRSGVFDTEPCAATKCVAERIDGSCLERPQILGDGVDVTSGEIGILLDAFTTYTVPAAYRRGKTYSAQFIQPAGEVRGVTPSSLAVDTTVFYYFYFGTDFGRCSGSFAVASNPLQTLAIAPSAFSNTTWVVFNTDAQLYLHAVSSSWSSNPNYCNGNGCDALNHVLVNDLDGQLTTFLRPTSVISNYAPQGTDCVLLKAWNAYHCQGLQLVRGSLLLTSLDDEQRAMEPMSVRNVNLGNIVMQALQPPLCAGLPENCAWAAVGGESSSQQRPVQFTALISLGTAWDIDLSTSTPPFNMELSLGHCNLMRSAVILNIAYPNFRDLEGELTVWAYPGGKSHSMFGESNGKKVSATETEFSTVESQSGEHFFDSKTMRLRTILRCGDTIEIHQLPIGTIQFYLGLPIHRFHYQEAAFLQRLASFLSIHPKRVFAYSTFQQLNRLIVGIRSLDGVDFNAATAALEINSHISRLISLDGAALSAQLELPITAALSAAFADAIEKPVKAPALEIPMSIGLIIAIVVLAAFSFAAMVFAQRQAYKFILQYKDEKEKKREEEEETLEATAEVAQGTTQLTQAVGAPDTNRPKTMFVTNTAGSDRPFA